MIGVVCLNPALDVTHHVAAVDWSGVNRPDEVHARPGGKGLNVARTLHALGTEVLVMGLAGGTTGQAVTAALAALAVPSAFTWVRGRRGGRSPSWTGGPATWPCSTNPARGSRRTGTRSSGPGTRRSSAGARPWSCPGACRRACPPAATPSSSRWRPAPGCRCCWTRTARRCGWAPRPGPRSSSRTWPSWRCSPGGPCPGQHCPGQHCPGQHGACRPPSVRPGRAGRP